MLLFLEGLPSITLSEVTIPLHPQLNSAICIYHCQHNINVLSLLLDCDPQGGSCKYTRTCKYTRPGTNNTRFLLQKSFFKDFIYLFFRERRREGENRKRNINVWLPLTCPLLGTWPATQAYAPTGNRIRLAPNPLSHTSQGTKSFITKS